jgi:type VI secretion system protein ImpA
MSKQAAAMVLVPSTRELATIHDWLTPVASDAPCGVDLEYDPEFVVLASQVEAKVGAQYGDFVGVPEPVNWSDVDRDCRRLMLRSKDMRVAVLFTRCRTRLAAAQGLAEGLGLLAAWLAAWPEAIHPQPDVDEDPNAALEIRMNALQSLTDTDGLLADVRDIALTRASAVRLQVRDVERAFIHPRPMDALAPESVTRQLEDLRIHQPGALVDFDRALDSAMAIEAWSREHLGASAPDLSMLTRLLRRVTGEEGQRVPAELSAASAGPAATGEAAPDITHRVHGTEAPHGQLDGITDSTFATTSDDAVNGEMQGTHGTTGGEPAVTVPSVETQTGHRTHTAPASLSALPVGAAVILNRAAALERIRSARHWFEQHEPSSPVAVLLRRAEQLVGKRYAEVVSAIPAELLTQWEGE